MNTEIFPLKRNGFFIPDVNRQIFKGDQLN